MLSAGLNKKARILGVVHGGAPAPRSRSLRAPVIVAALRQYFELLWDRATPLTTPRPLAGDRLPPAQQRVLKLMAEGLQDAAIAGCAQISTTAVRRHITAIMTGSASPPGSQPGPLPSAKDGSASTPVPHNIWLNASSQGSCRTLPHHAERGLSARSRADRRSKKAGAQDLINSVRPR